jgi:DNA-binding Xre family transcriptional regulator
MSLVCHVVVASLDEVVYERKPMREKNYIKEWRLSKGMTAAELSRMIGVDRSQVHLLENGKRRLTLDAMTQIALALSISPEELMSPPKEGVFAAGAPFVHPESRKPFEAGQRASMEGVILQVALPYKLQAVVSDEMEPTLSKGDYVILNTDDTQASSGLFVLRSGDTSDIRRVQRIGTMLRISCDNPRYASIDLGPSDFHAVGRVSAIVKSV